MCCIDDQNSLGQKDVLFRSCLKLVVVATSELKLNSIYWKRNLWMYLGINIYKQYVNVSLNYNDIIQGLALLYGRL